MKIGVGFPYPVIGNDPDVYLAYIQRAEDLGFSFMTFIDHVLGAEHDRRDPPLSVPYDEESIFHEPLTLISWAAAHTERLEFVTAILIVAQRQAALVAKQTAEIQLLSGGRLRLGVGTGWNHVEYESLDVPFHNRGARLEEQVDVMRKLWTEPVVDFAGSYHRIDRAGLRPLLGTSIPIWFGGFSRAQQDRCARIGDGFIWERALMERSGPGWELGFDLDSSNPLTDGVAYVRARAVELGRDPESIGQQLGTAETGRHAAELADPWASLGGTHITVAVPGKGPDLIAGLDRVAADLGSLLADSRP